MKFVSIPSDRVLVSIIIVEYDKRVDADILVSIPSDRVLVSISKEVLPGVLEMCLNPLRSGLGFNCKYKKK